MKTADSLALNRDTNFLKLAAILFMTLDHVGSVFFPAYPVFRLVGRLAFPLFAYCIVVGCLYTHDIKRYFLRLGVFAVVSQPFSALYACQGWEDFLSRLPVLNIFFTLIVGLAAVWGLNTRRWWLTVAAVLFSAFFNLDYGAYGVLLMLLLYLLRSNRLWCAVGVGAYLALDLLQLGRWPEIAALQGFAILSLPLILLHTNFNPKIHKYFFYAYYPAHLLVIFLLRQLVQ